MSTAVPFLSFSKIEKVLDCGLKFRFRYVDKIPEPTNGLALAGNAIHAVVEKCLEAKKAGAAVFPQPNAVVDMFHAEWKREIAEATAKKRFMGFNWDRPVEDLFDESKDLACWIVAKFLPTLPLPEKVEYEFNVEVETPIGPVRVNGFMDYVAKDGTLYDWKSSDEVKSHHRKRGYQLPCYSIALGATPGMVTLAKKVIFIRGAEPHAAVLPFEIEERHRERFRYVVGRAWMLINAEGFLPNNQSHLCSKQWCPYWDGCEGELK